MGLDGAGRGLAIQFPWHSPPSAVVGIEGTVIRLWHAR
jgi:hypothetical protein